jgi:hypothetical protein
MVPSPSGMEDTKGAGQQAYTTHGTAGHWNARQHDGNARQQSRNARECWAPHSHLYQAPCCFTLPVTIE